MWLRKAVSLPWQLLGVVGVLSVTAAFAPLKIVTSLLGGRQRLPPAADSRRSKRMPKEFYDVQEVSAMLSMVQAAMYDKSQQLHLQHSKVQQLDKQVEELQENLENANYLFVQEQQHRLALQAELHEAEVAAADLRQMLAVYFGDSRNCSPDSSPDTPKHKGLNHDHAWMLASSLHQLPSGLPGTLNRGDSRLQVELAGIQNRLRKIAKLRDTPPSSPRGERISPWPSLSTPGSPSATAETGRLGRLGTLSPHRNSPLKAGSAHRAVGEAHSNSDTAASVPAADSASLQPEGTSQQTAGLGQSAAMLADAVSLDSHDKAADS